MARKKKHQEAPGGLSESSDEGRRAGCTHINRALDVGQLKRVLRDGLPLRCQGCPRAADAPAIPRKTDDGPALPSESPAAFLENSRSSSDAASCALVTVCDAPEAIAPPETPVTPSCSSEVVTRTPSFASNTVEASLPESSDSLKASLPEPAREAVPVMCPNSTRPTLPDGDKCAEEFVAVSNGVASSHEASDVDGSTYRGFTSDRRPDGSSGALEKIVASPLATPAVSLCTRVEDTSPDVLPSTADGDPVACVASDAMQTSPGTVLDASRTLPDTDPPAAAPSNSPDTSEIVASVHGPTAPSANPLKDVTASPYLVCLRCGHRGCGSEGSHHALLHFSTPRLDLHCLAVSLDTWQLWCYRCDAAVEPNRRLEQAVQFVRKRVERQAGRAEGGPGDAAVSRTGTVPHGTSLSRGSRCSAKKGLENRETEKGVDTSLPPTPREGGGDGGPETKRVKGLANIGNTCYFNSVMQSLGQTTHLEEILRERCRQGVRTTFHPAKGSTEVGPLDVELPQPWPLTRALLEFMQEMRCGKPRPRPVFLQVCNIAPQFCGNQQNDSHELLRHLLEGVCNEEAKRQKQAVLASFGLSSKVDPGRVDGTLKRKIQAYKEAVSRTALDSLFGGVLLSTVVCQECGNIQHREESFKDLSLPIPDDKPLRLPRKVPEETGGRKTDWKGRRKNRDRKARACWDTESNTTACTLSGGGSQEPAEAEEADDEGAAAAAEEAARAAPVAPAETLAPRPLQPQDGSLLACLHQFTAPELLAGANALLCEGCGEGVRSPASLQLLVQQPPRVLTLHLKRFHQNGRSLCKVNRHIPFPLLLDLAPYCSPQKLERGPVPYALYAVVEHSGRLSGGHYTAYVKVRSGEGTSADAPPEGRWYHASDAHVADVTEATVLESQAYLLFYERLQ